MKLLQFIIIGCIVSAFTYNACTINSTQDDMPEQDPESDQAMTSLTFDNMGVTASVVLGVDGGSFDLRSSGRPTRTGKALSTAENILSLPECLRKICARAKTKIVRGASGAGQRRRST